MINDSYVFPNELNSRNQVALPNTVWAMDLTVLKQKIKRKEQFNLKLLVIMDFATREIITSKIFLVKDQGSIRAKYVVRELKRLVEQKNISDEIIIHSDRGSEFTSKEYTTYIKSNAFLIGSMSNVATPTDNAVVERSFRTLKSQLNEAKTLDDKYKSLYYAEIAIKERIRYYNETHKSRALHFTTRTESRQKLIETNVEPPKIRLHWKNNDRIDKEITGFKQKVIINGSSSRADILTERILNTNEVVERLEEKANVAESVLYSLHEQMLEIKDQLSKKSPKKKRIQQPLRQPANETIYDYLMEKERPTRYNRFAWSRNRIAITLLFYLGLRVNEVVSFSGQMVEDGLKFGKIQVLQPKTSQYKVILFTEALKKAIKEELLIDIQVVFREKTDILGVNAKTRKRITPKKWINTINCFVKPTIELFGQRICSHSFRINFITQLLRFVPIQEVTNVVGHKSIATTQLYNRYKVDSKEMSIKIDQALRPSKK